MVFVLGYDIPLILMLLIILGTFLVVLMVLLAIMIAILRRDREMYVQLKGKTVYKLPSREFIIREEKPKKEPIIVKISNYFKEVNEKIKKKLAEEAKRKKIEEERRREEKEKEEQRRRIAEQLQRQFEEQKMREEIEAEKKKNLAQEIISEAKDIIEIEQKTPRGESIIESEIRKKERKKPVFPWISRYFRKMRQQREAKLEADRIRRLMIQKRMEEERQLREAEKARRERMERYRIEAEKRAREEEQRKRELAEKRREYLARKKRGKERMKKGKSLFSGFFRTFGIRKKRKK